MRRLDKAFALLCLEGMGGSHGPQEVGAVLRGNGCESCWQIGTLGVGDTLHDGLKSFFAHTTRQQARGVHRQYRYMGLLGILYQREVVVDERRCRLDTLMKRCGIACSCQ